MQGKSEEEGDAVVSATDDNTAAGALDKQIVVIYSCRSNNIILQILLIEKELLLL